MTKPAATSVEERRELHLRVAIRSVQNEVSNVVARIADWLNLHKVEEEIVNDQALAVAEALNNVVEHAYLYREDGRIDILVALSASQVMIEIVDTGLKFDGPPPYRELAPENIPLEELPEGGFGWSLIRSLTDTVEFQYRDGQNQLRLTRVLTHPPVGLGMGDASANVPPATARVIAAR